MAYIGDKHMDYQARVLPSSPSERENNRVKLYNMTKTILLTISTSVAVMIVVLSLFLNSILGVFNLVTTSVNTMRSLQASNQIVKKMKVRHSQKKAAIAKKIAKKSSRRVASATLAAVTIGAVAVAVTVAGLEVYDYCEEKGEHQEDANILYSTNTKFDFKQCIKEGKEDSKAILDEVKNSTTIAVHDAMNSTVKYSSEKWTAIKDMSMQSLDSSKTTAAELWDSSKSWLDR